MKRFLYVFSYLSIALLFFSFKTVKAQTFVTYQTWDFETTADTWVAGDDKATLSISTDKFLTGTHSLKVAASGTSVNTTIQNNTFKPATGDLITYHVWVSTTDAANINGAQIFWQDGGSAWAWNSQWVNGSTFVGNSWNTITFPMPAFNATLDRIGIQIIANTASSTPTYYVDAITVGSPAPIVTSPLITSWGYYGPVTAGWRFTSGVAGSAKIGGAAAPTGANWAIIRGQFGPLTTTTSSAVVVTGQMVVDGDLTSWAALRFSLTNCATAGTNTDTTGGGHWTGAPGQNYGYLFSPYTAGAQNAMNWNAGNPAGNATVGGIVNRPPNSTNNNASNYTMGEIFQAPARASMVKGTYNFAFSVQAKADGTNELRFYMIKDDNKYYFGSTITDTAKTRLSRTFNSLCFSVDNGNGIGTTANPIKTLTLNNVQAQMGLPITVPTAPWSDYYIDQWGFYANNTGGWQYSTDGIVGDATVSGANVITGTYAILRGGFVSPITPTTTLALNVTGQITFDKTMDHWSALRYGLFYSDSAGVVDTSGGLKTAFWNGNKSKSGSYANHNYGYLFAPYSGTNDPVGWNAGNPSGNGTHGGLWNRPVNSTNNQANNYVLGEFLPAPARAAMVAGTYNFDITVQPLANGTTQLSFYLIKDDNKYYFGGTSIDTVTWRKETKFNSVCFSIMQGNGNVDVRSVSLSAVKLNMGTPTVIPPAPWSPYYISSWGFFGGKNGGGWKYSTDGIVGDGTISGTKGPAGWAAIRGGFVGSVKPTTSKALIVKGSMELVGGGFESWSSLNLGLFYNSSPGTVDTSGGLATAKWSGTDNNELGYLFTPPSNKLPGETYGMTNLTSVGAIANEPWLNTSGTSPFDANNGNYVLSGNPQNPADAVGGAGIYDFAISVEPLVNGRTEIRYQIQKEDKSYNFAGTIIDGHTPAKMTQFNGIHFAINNPATTALILTSVKVDLGSPITISNSYSSLTSVQNTGAGIPTNYSLSQNYPNPFNPTTNIEFSLPKNSNVKLVVYDVLGKVVTELVNGDLNAGYYKINFNASNLASGIYFYSLKTGDFVNVKKLMLLK
jgi:hypothetical protein